MAVPKYIPALVVLLQILTIQLVWGQHTEDSIFMKPKILHLAKEIIQETEKTTAQLQENALKNLQQLQQLEAKLAEKVPADQLDEVKQLKDQMAAKLQTVNGLTNPDSLLKSMIHLPYIARFDSLQTLLKFSMPNMADNALLQQAQQQIDVLKAQFSQLTALEAWIQEREGQWKNVFSKVNLEKLALPKAFGKWQEQALAYKMQVQQWKETINDPQKIEQEALKLLNKLPAFREFMSQNGELARLFGSPAGSANAPAGQPIPGLQTRASLAQELQNRFGEAFMQSGGALQQQIQAGMDQLADMQNPIAEKLNELKQANPFQVSPAQEEKAALKALPLKKRFEFGINLQSATRIHDFPAVRDIGLSLGYKLNPRSVAGVGIAYKFALGESWKDIQWTHEGIGLRSFFDWRLASAGSKLLKGFWITGGFEMNYWSRIARDAQWGNLAWEKSGLVGVTKVVKVKDKNIKMMIAFNILKTSAIIQDRVFFRIQRQL